MKNLLPVYCGLVVLMAGTCRADIAADHLGRELHQFANDHRHGVRHPGGDGKPGHGLTSFRAVQHRAAVERAEPEHGDRLHVDAVCGREPERAPEPQGADHGHGRHGDVQPDVDAAVLGEHVERDALVARDVGEDGVRDLPVVYVGPSFSSANGVGCRRDGEMVLRSRDRCACLGAARRAGAPGDRSPRRAGRFLLAEAAHHRPDRHRQRAGRPDVDGPVPRLLEPVRRRGPGGDHVHVDAEPRAARRHPLGHRRLRASAAEPAEASARISGGRGLEGAGGVWTTRVRHGRRGARTPLGRLGSDPAGGRPIRSAAAVDRLLGRDEHTGPGAVDCARHEVAGRTGRAHLAAARLFDLRPGRRGLVDSPRVSAPALHRVAVHAGWGRVLLRDVDRHQRRSFLPQRSRRRLHDLLRCVGERAHPSEGAARQALSASLLHPRRRYAVVSRPHRQRSGQRNEPDLRRMGRAVHLATAVRRAARDLDRGRRLVSRQRQLARHGDWRRWSGVHVGPGDDLAMADGVSARLRGAHGRGRSPTPRTPITTPRSS